MATEKNESPKKNLRARLVALATLAAFGCGISYVARESYLAATDSFVIPTVLSPDSDIVIQSKLKAAELEVERSRAGAEIEAIEADLTAAQKTHARLEELRGKVADASTWMVDSNARLASAGGFEMSTLVKQRKVIADMVAQQEQLVNTAEANLAAGLTTKGEVAKEVQFLNQLRVELLENDRTRVQNQLHMQEVTQAQRTLARGAGPMMPELVVREDQLVRVELELFQLESEQRAKTTERRLALGKLAKIDELGAQLRARPTFRAMEKSVDVAFVPYTQREAVAPGAAVYDCVWGLFHCKVVGKVTEIVPGEVILPDPWGNQARGQYAVLEVQDRDAIKSKTLRVRSSFGALPQAQAGEPVAAR